ncbi:MAG: hypothetical protein J6A16_06150 [Oscillospiraceae bacterium]|nr:hypothetical protein [Oscillospiraceae bacterium]
MNTPKLDSRSVEDILALIKKKSEFYTPEWMLDPDDPDGGAALAQLFAEMFHGTIDRYNRFPDKCYLEFLNMIGVCAKSVSPSVGMAAADLVDGAQTNVFIKSGTQLFTDISDEENGDKRVVYETVSGMFATPAELKSIYMTFPDEDIITGTDVSDEDAFPLLFFSPESSKNIERHAFAVAHAYVLKLNGSAEISLKLTNLAMTYKDAQLMQQLCSSDFAEWSFISEKGKLHLDAAFVNDHIVLSKPEGELIFTDDSGNRPQDDEEASGWIFCEMKKTSFLNDIFVDHIYINSRSLNDAETGNGITPSHIFYNDNELSAEEAGYCFGKGPAVYDVVYIDCPEAFSKCGADVTIDMSVSTVILKDFVITDVVGQEFNNKLVVDKEDTKAAPPDDIYISEVQWEYWNGYGWAKLDVKGNVNPFSCHGEEGKKTVSFTCPDDFEASVQNAYEGMWIRIRVREVENSLSTHSRWLVPWLKGVNIRFDYGSTYLPVQAVSVCNNCEKTYFETDGSPASLRLFRLMPDKYDTVYFMFDSAPAGYPVNFYFEFAGSDDEERDIIFEYLAVEHGTRSVWREIKADDHTGGFSASGIISLYTPSDFAHVQLFGQEGCWIRAVKLSKKRGIHPRLCSIHKNVVEIIQKESVNDERHDYIAGKLWQEVVLANRPIISCDLWVNELGETSVSELNELKRLDSSSVRMVTDDDGQLTECWVRWQPRMTLSDSSSSDRHYQLDYSRGAILFGDGTNGKIPAYSGDTEISIDYSFGGGSMGNLPAGAIDGLIVGIPFVERMTNIEATCGGSNGQSLDAIRRIGAARLKHRGRAVTSGDFETLVMEQFTEVEEVRCFCGRNRNAVSENGSITIVVKSKDLASATYSAALCRRIEDFLCKNASLEPVAGGRLSVIPARVMRVSAEVIVQIDDYEYAVQTERAVITAINDIMGSTYGGSIGRMPTVSAVYTALKKVEHISYVSRVLLTGEYYHNSEKVIVSLDDSDSYRYFIAAAGTHIVKI